MLCFRLSHIQKSSKVTPFDFFVLLVIYRVSTRPKAILAALKSHVKCGNLSSNLIKVCLVSALLNTYAVLIKLLSCIVILFIMSFMMQYFIHFKAGIESTIYILYISYRVTGLYRLGKTCYLHSLLCNNSIIAQFRVQ